MRLRKRVARRSGQSPRRYVFVLTFGRSGSTLLQAILNATPGVLIRGENRGITRELFDFHATAVREKVRVTELARRPFNPWFGMCDYPTEVAITRIRELLVDTLLRPEPDTEISGFKEIRWSFEDLGDFVSFLREVFPGARFIVNTRRLEDSARSMAGSGWWPEVEDPLVELQLAEQRLLTVADQLGDDAYVVRYDDYVDAPDRLRGLFEWLGLEFDEQRVRRSIDARTYAQPPARRRKQ